jgi:hypothetical protein
LHRQLSRQSRQQLRKQLHRPWLLKLQLQHYWQHLLRLMQPLMIRR